MSSFERPFVCSFVSSFANCFVSSFASPRDNSKHLVIRETHKSFPFPYEKAWVDQIGNFDYVNKIVPLIVKLIINNCNGVYNVGTEEKTLYELAIQSKEVKPTNKPHYFPTNTTMDLTKLNNTFKNE